MKSNINISSNIMVWDENIDYREHIAGDYISQIYPECADVRYKNLTNRQKIELEQYLICLKCGKPCAGTCEF